METCPHNINKSHCFICAGVLPPGTVVQIVTHDIFHGDVDTVGIIRYWDENHYEIDAILKDNLEAPGVQNNIGWWSVSPSEIKVVHFIIKPCKKSVL